MSELADYLKDLWQPWAPVRARRMFGGVGLFREDRMFALISNEALYLKVDAVSEAAFVEQGLEPFVYHKQGRPVSLSFRQAPAELFDDPEAAAQWAQIAWEAALRAGARR